MRATLLFGAHSSSRLSVPPVGRRARSTRTTPSKYVRTTLLFGAHSASRLMVASVPRQLCHIDHSAAELPKPYPSDLFAPRSASMLQAHLREPPAQVPRPLTCTFVLLFRAEAYARRATDKHTRINPSKDHRRGLRLLREPIGLHTTLLSEPDRPSRNPLGLRAPCSRSLCRSPGPPWEGTVGAHGMFEVSRLAIFFSTRVIVWVSVHTSIRLAHRTNCCALFLLKIVHLLI